MAYPQITVEIAFTNNPINASPINFFTDITDYVIAIPSIRRGRQSPFTGIEAGTAVVVLDNRTRAFDPTYASGAFSPYVLPGRRIRIRATWSGTNYYLFDGFIDTWPPAWEASNKNSTVTITCTDAFKFFNLATVSSSLPAEATHYALDTLLNLLGWPSTWRNGIGNVAVSLQGQAFIKAITVTNKNALQHIQDLMDAESGLFFIDGQGRATFHNRHFRFLRSEATTSNGTFGDGGGSELPYQSLNPAYDDTQVWNDVHVTADAGTEQIASDSTSQTTYFKRTLTKTGLLYGDATPYGGQAPDNEAASMASWLLYNYKNPSLRFDRITLEGGYSDSLWPHMLGREISDRITVKRRPPPNGSSTITKDCWIEAVEHRITDITGSYLRWQTSWQLSEANSQAWWILNDTTYSVLDSTTIPAF